jgi:protein ImuB
MSASDGKAFGEGKGSAGAPGAGTASRARPPGDPPPSVTAFWICCRFPQLPLDTLGAGLPADQPFALIDTLRDESRHSRGGGRGTRARSVLAANALAESQGVRAGMSLATAYGLCPHLRCHGRMPDAEAQRLRQLADTAYGFTPLVSLLPPDALLLECAGTLRLFGGAEPLLQRLEDTWRTLGHACEFGIAHTPLAATILARARRRLTSGPSLAARTRQALEQVHLRHLSGHPWAPALIEQFAASGIDTLGAVLALPRPAVGRRFGRSVLTDLGRMLGEHPDPRAWIRPQPDFRSHLNLLDTLRQRTGLVFPMHRLLRELVAWLRARQLLVTRIEWRFVDAARSAAHGSTHSSTHTGESCIEVRLATPGMDDRRLLALTELQLERSALPEEIAGITLCATGLATLAAQAASPSANPSLFRNAHEQRPPEELLDLVRARLGAAALHGLALGDDHRPEAAWLAIHAPTVGRQGEAAPTQPPANHRPLWLLVNPQALEGQRFELLRGPERVESAWWAYGEHAPPGTVPGSAQGITPGITSGSDVAVRRDYYLARTARGELCWIFRRHDDGAWFLHGYFA